MVFRLLSFFLLALPLASCRTVREAQAEVRATADTLRATVYVHDTLRLADTVRERFITRADTVWAVREVVRWRDRTSLRRDTLLHLRRDTVRVAVREEVEVPPRPARGLWLMAAGAVAGGAAACLLLRKVKSEK